VIREDGRVLQRAGPGSDAVWNLVTDEGVPGAPGVSCTGSCRCRSLTEIENVPFDVRA